MFEPLSYGVYDQAYRRPSRMPPRRQQPKNAPEVEVMTDASPERYTVAVEAKPVGAEILDVHPAIEQGALTLEGSVIGRCSGMSDYEYVVHRRTPLYDTPGSRPISIIPAGTVFKGSAPSGGWVALEDE